MAKKKEPGKFTVITKLNPAHNKEIIDAFETECHAFNQAKIQTFHHIRSLAMEGRSFGTREQSAWNTVLQHRFQIVKRTANSIIYEARTIWQMKTEASKTELSQNQKKRDSLIKEISELEKKKSDKKNILEGRKPLKRKKKESDEEYTARSKVRYDKTAQEQRNLRARLVSKKKALNRLNDRIKKQEEIIRTDNYRICFGTKKLQTKDPKAFQLHRDHQMSFTGSDDETAENQIFQLYYSKSRNQFDIRMRRDFYEKPEVYEERTIRHRAKDGKPAWTEKKTVRLKEDEASACAKGRVHFSYGKHQIVHALKNLSGPLSCRIIKEKGEYYLYCIFDWKEEGKVKFCPSLNTKQKDDAKIQEVIRKAQNRKPSAVGVDVNKGFLSAALINRQGGLIDTFNLYYRFGAGNRTKSDLAYLVSRIVHLALMLDIPVVMEDINLSAKKWRSRRKGNRALNRMLHSFAYTLYKDLMEAACFRYGVKLIKVDPAWTSETARRKYCIIMKLCVHNGAAWVIARRGMEFCDALPEKLDPKEKFRLFKKDAGSSLLKNASNMKISELDAEISALEKALMQNPNHPLLMDEPTF